jgi:PIN domain nuclease of toxin-antitoxin system
LSGRLLLDTSVLIRIAVEPALLAAPAREAIESAQVRKVSIVSLWEVVLKHRIGKLPLDLARAEAVMRACGMTQLDLSLMHLLALQALPVRADHQDPFDHLLLAQAQHEGLTLVTSDRRLHGYGVSTLAA